MSEELKQPADSLFQEEKIVNPEILDRFEVGLKTVASERHPDRNEDALIYDRERGSFGVFDGIGGEPAPYIASHLTAKYFDEELSFLSDESSAEEIEREFKKIFQKVNERLKTEAEGKPEWYGMGSTASVVKVVKDRETSGYRAVIGNIGDSRVYLLNNAGRLEQLTLDDSYTRHVLASNNRVKARELQQRLNTVSKIGDLADNDERNSFINRSIIYQLIGEDNINPDFYIVDIGVGDKLIIVSDGVSDNLTDLEIEKILRETPENQKASKMLVESARTRSKEKVYRSKLDDMTALVVGIAQN